jgi:hypothetical protein
LTAPEVVFVVRKNHGKNQKGSKKVKYEFEINGKKHDIQLVAGVLLVTAQYDDATENHQRRVCVLQACER